MGEVPAKTDLKQKRCETNGRHHHQGQRTHKRAMAGINDDQGESEQQEAGSEDGPAARRGTWGRVRRVVRQGIPPQVNMPKRTVSNAALLTDLLVQLTPRQLLRRF